MNQIPRPDRPAAFGGAEPERSIPRIDVGLVPHRNRGVLPASAHVAEGCAVPTGIDTPEAEVGSVGINEPATKTPASDVHHELPEPGSAEDHGMQLMLRAARMGVSVPPDIAWRAGRVRAGEPLDDVSAAVAERLARVHTVAQSIIGPPPPPVVFDVGAEDAPSDESPHVQQATAMPSGSDESVSAEVPDVDQILARAAEFGVALTSEQAERIRADRLSPHQPSPTTPASVSDHPHSDEPMQVEPTPRQPSVRVTKATVTVPRSRSKPAAVSTDETYHEAALSRLRGETTEPVEIADIREAITRRAVRALGKVVGEKGIEVSDVLPQTTPLLRKLGGVAVSPDVKDDALEAYAHQLGVSVDANEIRTRLLAMVHKYGALPEFGDFVLPDLEMITEGLTVGSRLNEYRILHGVPPKRIALTTGVDQHTLANFFTRGIRPEPATVGTIVGALDIPASTADRVMDVYAWELSMRNRAASQAYAEGGRERWRRAANRS